MASDAATLAELNAALTREDYTLAIEICNKIRAKNPNDQDAIKIKCVALIRMKKFEKALELASKYPFLLSERVYCHYRLKQDKEALALIPTTSTSPVMLHLAAQLHFRQENFSKAIELYEQLLAVALPGEDLMELHTNLLAAYASAGRSKELIEREIPIEDNYEIAFNKSFMAIEMGEWGVAEEYLVEAEKLCREAFDGASTAEIEDQVAIIRTQQAFVKQMQGNTEGALSEYRNILKLKLSNQAVGAVASNNLVTIRKDRDLADSFKRLKAIDAIVLNEKLSRTQQEAILINRALLLCLLHKLDECRELVTTLTKQFPHSRRLSELMVFLAIQGQNPDQAIATLEKDTSLGGRLGLAHLYLAKGLVIKAAQCIDAIESIQHTPGTVATLVTMYEAAGDSKAALAVLRRAMEHHQAIDFTSETAMKIREGDCAYKVQKKQYKEAAQAYLDLIEGDAAAVTMDPELRLQSLATLVIALSFSDAAAAEMRCALLPPVAECDIDPIELEQQAQLSSRLASKLVVDGNERKRAAKNPERIAAKRTKRREAYLASLRSRPDYNASIGLLNPDPERWIPKKQRSHGKRGRRSRNRFVGAQGSGMGTDKDAAKLDAAARAAMKAETADEKKAIVVSSDSSMMRKAKKKKRR